MALPYTTIEEGAAILAYMLILGLRPPERVRFVTEFEASGFAIEFPIDLLPDAVHPAVPLLSLSAQRL